LRKVAANLLGWNTPDISWCGGQNWFKLLRDLAKRGRGSPYRTRWPLNKDEITVNRVIWVLLTPKNGGEDGGSACIVKSEGIQVRIGGWKERDVLNSSREL